jgi:hypothetical protein
MCIVLNDVQNNVWAKEAIEFTKVAKLGFFAL